MTAGGYHANMFYSVSRYKGLFYFDSSFRPIPLEQHFLAIKGKAGSAQSRKNMDHVTYQKVSELVEQGHQVMVFVHARKETVKAAMTLKEMAQMEGTLDDFSCMDHPQFDVFRRSISESRNKEMRSLFDSGFGIHHAGMLRSDRNLMERMFEARALKVCEDVGCIFDQYLIPAGPLLHCYPGLGSQSASTRRSVHLVLTAIISYLTPELCSCDQRYILLPRLAL